MPNATIPHHRRKVRFDEHETLHFPQFADWDFESINGAAELKKIKEEAAKPLVVRKEKPLPWYAPERHPFLLEMLYKREARSMPMAHEAGVSDEKKQRFKRGEA